MTATERRAARRAEEAAADAGYDVWTLLHSTGPYGRTNALQYPTKAQAMEWKKHWDKLGHWTNVVHGSGC